MSTQSMLRGAGLAAACLLAAIPLLRAKTFELEVPGEGTLTIVEADPGASTPVTGNTILASGLTEAWSTGPDGPQTPGLWRQRNTWGGVATNFSGVFTGNGTTVPPAVGGPLRTSVNVPPGRYAVYVVLGSDRRDPSVWAGGSINAALAGGSRQLYASTNSVFTGLAGPEFNAASDLYLWGVFVAKLGEVEGSSLAIEVDGDGQGRPLYYGLAYKSLGPTSQLLAVEDFNTDGDGSRYQVSGRGLNAGAPGGPAYWAHNFDVPYVGLPPAAPARRAAVLWHHNLPYEAASEDALSVIDATIQWLLNNKPNANILFSPGVTGTGDQVLVDRLWALGHTVTDDWGELPPAGSVDLVVQSSSGTIDEGRFANYPVPLLSYNGATHDDEGLSSAGTVNTGMDPNPVQVQKTGHPATGGKTGTFNWVTPPQSLASIGMTLAPGAEELISFEKITPVVVTTVGVSTRLISGELSSIRATNTAPQADLGRAGFGTFDHVVPGDPAPTLNFCTLATGTLNVTQAGTFSFALVTQDGGRLRIDRDKNGFDPGDTVIEVNTLGGQFINKADVTFADAGPYRFEWIGFTDDSGAFTAEIAVAIEAGSTPLPIDSGAWEILGDPAGISPVTLAGEIEVVSFLPDKPLKVDHRSVLVVLEKGAPMLGGLLAGAEGGGFFAGANLADAFGGGGPRTLTLGAVNLSNTADPLLTVAVASSGAKFENGDFLRLSVDPDGEGPAPFAPLVTFQPDTSNYLVGAGVRLESTFQDVSLPLPTHAPAAIIRFEAMTDAADEIVAFDNVRISSGALVSPTIDIDVPGLGTLKVVEADPGDALPLGNTRLLSGLDEVWSTGPDGAQTPGLWRQRNSWGGVAPPFKRVFTGSGTTTPPAVGGPLRTSATIPRGRHEIYIVYSSDQRAGSPAGGSINAALAGGTRTLFDNNNGIRTDYHGPEFNTAENLYPWYVVVAKLGEVEGPNVAVDVDGNGLSRPLYYGFGYRAVGGEVPTVQIRRQGPDLVIEFTGVLQSSTLVSTGYSDVAGATSPLLILATELTGQRFYRARSQ